MRFHLGYIEFVLSPAAFLAGQPEYVLARLALHPAVRWESWKEPMYGRNRLQKFLFRALSVVAGFVTYLILDDCICEIAEVLNLAGNSCIPR